MNDVAVNNTAPPRIAGWLLLPLAWLIMALLTSSLVLVMYISPLFDPGLRPALMGGAMLIPWSVSLLTVAIVWVYSLWVMRLFCKRSRRLPRHYIIWLLLTVLLAVKTFAFSPISDGRAMQMLLLTLLAAAVFAPLLRQSRRAKLTFIGR